jgi:hypothetical protein
MDVQVDIKDAALLANMQAGGSPNPPPGELQGYASGILPSAHPALKPEDEPQKWVQCAKCSLWRKVSRMKIFDPLCKSRLPGCISTESLLTKLTAENPIILHALF